MTMTVLSLASGPGWSVDDVICTAGPHDPPFEERHGSLCIAAVTSGTFQYSGSQGRAFLSPGAILLGNYGHCFECGHDHGTGDRCLAFHFEPSFFEEIAAAVPGVRTIKFPMSRLAPSPALTPLLAAAEAAREDCEEGALEELALRVAGAIVAALVGGVAMAAAPNAKHERQISRVVRTIEAEIREPSVDDALSLTRLAREAAMSPYHFLRAFTQIVGMTPHQFVLRARLHRAAVQLLNSRDQVSDIAFAAGFNDLSTFNRRFRRIMGESPGVYRSKRG